MDGMLASGAGLFVLVLLFVLGIVWFFLPFAIIGIKDRLDLIIAELQKCNKALDQIVESQNRDRDVNSPVKRTQSS